jgi:hypothetical protein
MFGERPAHDWTSHAADAFRYLAVGLRDPATGLAGYPSHAITESPGERIGLLGSAGWDGADHPLAGGFAVGMTRQENGVEVECHSDGRWRPTQAIMEE